MASNNTKFGVGLFVLGGITLIVLAMIWMGVNKSIDKSERYVIFFDESIQGLDVGSQVKYRGVPVGRVENLSIAPDAKLIQAIIEIRPEHNIADHSVAQLKSVGITGTVYIGLDVITDDKLAKSPDISFPVKYPVIVSIPSSKSELMQSLDSIAKKAQATDTEGISDRLIITLDKVNKALGDLNIKNKSVEIDKLLKLADKNLQKLELLTTELTSITIENRAGINRSIKQFEVVLSNANKFIESSNIFVSDAKLLVNKGGKFIESGDERVKNMESSFNITLRNLDNVINNMDEFVTRIEQQPSLLLAPPPEPRKIK